METLQNYIFYLITNRENQNGSLVQYGVKRLKNVIDHEPYFKRLLNIDVIDIDYKISTGWNQVSYDLAAGGYIVFANSAVEIEDINEQLFLLYLPSHPLALQLKILEDYMAQFQQMNFDVGVYGDDWADYVKQRTCKDFSSIAFLEKYIEQHKSKI